METGELVKEKIYFLCGYEAHVKPVPHIRALEYMGTNTPEEGSEEEYVFREFQKGLKDAQCSDLVAIGGEDLHLVRTFDEMMSWFKEKRVELLKSKFDVRFNKWAALYTSQTRFLPFPVRRRLWRQVLKSIHLSVYLSNLGVVWPKIVDGKPTMESQVLGAGDFLISDIHSSPSIGPNIGVGMTVRTHNRRTYINFVCDRYRFREEEAKELVAHIQSGLLNSI